MKHMSKLALAAIASVSFGATTLAADKLRMATIAPGSSAYLVMTTMASTVNEAQDDVEMAQGKLDVIMTSPDVYHFLKNGTRMYQKLSSAPELSKNVGLVYWFPYGAYHVLAYSDSGISKLEDLRGKKVFLGPPGGGAWAAAQQWVKATTGMEPGKDYEKTSRPHGVPLLQGFQDRQFDVYVNGGIPPFPQVEQLALTSDLNVIGLSKEEVDNASEEMLEPTKVLGRSLDMIPAGIYGENVSSDGNTYLIRWVQPSALWRAWICRKTRSTI